MKKTILALMVVSGFFTACKKDENNSPDTSGNKRFTVTIENIATEKPFINGGVFNIPVGSATPGAATPGKKYEFTFNAGRKQYLSFATMLAATNDLFYGPDDEGIALYDDNGAAISAEVTDQIYLWDAGTEVNEEPAVGPNTVTNQSGPNTGADENGNVLKIENIMDSFAYPSVSEIIKVSIENIAGTEFKVTIENVSASDALMTSAGDFPAPLSPGAWVIHNGANPLYKEGASDKGQGIENIAEDGSPEMLGAYISNNIGVTYPASPGVWTTHTAGTMPLFTSGVLDYGKGIESIAEDGNPEILGTNINTLEGKIDGAVFNTPLGSSGPGAIKPGSKFQFSFDASAGEMLSFATMLAATNDVFFAPKDMGIALYNGDGTPISGDITDQVYLWDAGTEVNEQPAVGLNTVTNQLSANTGVTEEEPLQLLSDVNDGFNYPAVNTVIKVTITSN